MAATILDVLKERGDYVELSSRDEYAKYFNHINRALAMVMAWYQHIIEGGNADAKHTEVFLRKLLFNIEKWREKHLYDRAHEMPVDLNDSGFPNLSAVEELVEDLKLKDKRIATATPEEVLLRQMIDVMIEEKREPLELLNELSQGQYYASLDSDKILMPFTPGELQLVTTKEDHRKYLFSWSCYDYSSNLPFLHLMAFDQDLAEEPLEKKGAAYDEFVKAIKDQGSRAPSVGVLAMLIDENIKSVHPKVLKRAKIGPIICPRFTREKDPEPMMALLKEFGEEGDFAIRLMSEIILSERQEKKPVPVLDFGRSKRVREIFAIPQTDLRCFNQKASHVFDNLILPHRVLQLAVDDPRFAQYAKMGHIVYNQKGDLYVV